MRPYLIALLIISLSGPDCFAQTKVIDMADSTRHGLKINELERNYPEIRQLFAKQPKQGQDLTSQSMKQFQAFQKLHDLSPYKVGFLLREYVEPTGEATYVLVEWFGVTPDSTKQAVLKLLTDYYRTKRLNVTANIRFRTTVMYAGKFIEKRTVRTKPGAINTLETARNTTRPDTVKILYFNQLSLKLVPEIVYRFPNLIELDLSKNTIKTLPARLTTDLPKLERLSLLYNTLTNDSVFFAVNKHLKALNIQENQLTMLPVSIRKNRRLESLWAGSNGLKTVDFRGLRQLTDLNMYNAEPAVCPPSIVKLRRPLVLDLYHNSLTELPAHLSRLRRLEQLAVSHNKLRQLPEQLARLRRLQVLYAHHNEISILPDRFAFAAFACSTSATTFLVLHPPFSTDLPRSKNST